MFVHQLLTKVWILLMEDRLGVKTYNVQKCRLYESQLSESWGWPVYSLSFRLCFFLFPWLYIQTELKLSCCCCLKYFQLEIRKWKWFLVIISCPIVFTYSCYLSTMTLNETFCIDTVHNDVFNSFICTFLNIFQTIFPGKCKGMKDKNDWITQNKNILQTQKKAVCLH
jgi:hypothetical protein